MPPNIKLEHPPNNNNEDLDAPLPSQKICHACGANGVKNRCGACRQVYFCDRTCQKAIWVTHRPECQRLVADAKKNVSNGTNSTSNATIASNDTNTESNVTTMSDETTKSSIKTNSGETQSIHESNPEELLHLAPPPVSETSNDTPVVASSSPSTIKKKAVVLLPVPEVLPSPNDMISLENTLPSSSPSSSSKSSAKKKKHKKKKSRSNSLHAPASTPMARTKLKSRSQSLSVKKHVVWGEVRAREFTRFPGGGSTVPYDGSWALGLGSPVADVQLGSVLEVEELRLHELEARAKDLTKSQRAKVREGETRQFDYKNGIRNPLFGRLSEKERRKLFSKSEFLHLHELEEQVAHRKLSISSETPGDDAEPLEADFACVASEQLNEFAVIRDSRDDKCGCSCGDLLKKVTKMNVKKLHAFLNERNVKSSGHSKPELLAQAKAIAMREQNCRNSAVCECARNGVGCHANVCVGCAGDCHNPHSQYAYNKDQVVQYRKQMIAQWNEQQHDEGGSTTNGPERPTYSTQASICVA